MEIDDYFLSVDLVRRQGWALEELDRYLWRKSITMIPEPLAAPQLQLKLFHS
jgi:hypothetical protein